ncbi:Uma2 family endonuclease [Silvibacterium sp.]|uniref:Uma2 family endonuclease n=1 Tax=Silvibacterium sp. TaxID=1964179 RepID=UPI0039E61117
MSAIPQPVKVPVEEYLASSFRPDCDYVDGVIEERNLGEKEHSILQGAFYFLFRQNRKRWQVEVYPELRVQVNPHRFRVPDITVTRAGLKWERILREAPLLCVEILSPEDTMARIRQRVDDYLAMGTAHVWVIDPALRKGYVCSSRGFEEPENGVLAIPGSEIAVALSELFVELDEV